MRDDGALDGLRLGMVDLVDGGGRRAPETVGARVVAGAEDHHLAQSRRVFLDEIVNQSGADDGRGPRTRATDQVIHHLDGSAREAESRHPQQQTPRRRDKPRGERIVEQPLALGPGGLQATLHGHQPRGATGAADPLGVTSVRPHSSKYISYTNPVGRPPRIDRAGVLSAALALADERGLDTVTMVAIAERLDVTAMALYRHVAHKADLLDGVVELLLDEIVLPDARLHWSERLALYATSLRTVARRHPSAFPLLLQRPATTAQARRTRDAVCLALIEAGIAQKRVNQMQRLLSTAVLGFALSETAGRFQDQSAHQLDDDFAVLLQLLTSLIRSQADE